MDEPDLRQELLAGLTSHDENKRAQTLKSIGAMGEEGASSMSLSARVADLLRDSSPLVEKEALLTLGRLGSEGKKYGREIIGRLDVQDFSVAAAACTALGLLGTLAKDSAQVLMAVAKDHARHATVRAASLTSLGYIGAIDYVTDIAAFMEDQSPPAVAAAACGALESLGEASDSISFAVMKLLSSKFPDVKASALSYLAKVGDPSSCADAICACLADEDALVREAAVALVPASSAKAVAALLSSSDGRAKCAAASALGRLGEKAADYAGQISALLDDGFVDMTSKSLSAACICGKSPASMRVPKCAAAEALPKLGPAGTKFVDQVAALLSDGNFEVRASAALGLGAMGQAGAAHEAAVLKLLADKELSVKAMALTSLGLMGKANGGSSPATIEATAAFLSSQHPTLRASAVAALGNMGESALVFENKIMKCAQDRCSQVRASLCVALGALGPRAGVYAADVGRALYDADPRVRLAAAEALPKLGERGAALVEELADALGDPDENVRAAAATALGDLGDEAAALFLPSLQDLAADPSEAVQKAASAAVEKLVSS